MLVHNDSAISSDYRDRKDCAISLAELSIWKAKPSAYRANVSFQIALEAARKDRSDPFTFQRVRLSLLDNVTCPHDYGISAKEGEKLATKQ